MYHPVYLIAQYGIIMYYVVLQWMWYKAEKESSVHMNDILLCRCTVHLTVLQLLYVFHVWVRLAHYNYCNDVFLI